MSTTPVRRRTGSPGRPGYDLDTLLAVAVRVFNERGYDATSMDVLARNLGLTKSSIYHHVSGKEELLELALNRALSGLFAVITEPGATTGPSVDRLEYVLRRSVEVLVAELPYVTLLLRVRGNSDVERRALARRREFDAVIADLVAGAVDEGDVRADADPAVTSRLLFGMVNSLIEWYRPRADHPVGEVADALVAIAFDGLRRN
ncbi:TetR/AcrR family transcriptional regulator [Tsukamurella paurometabola]|uniref:HTH-type transcriptional repressor KstR2 n=1 Tax=Tsukamurella paurometabola TaxID=2061 RepID=A0A3P8KZ34_TSUPA|nr:TetR/AcrR family transcriptional regulator [Tsukamurella paurometabola]UEA84351.1 TetR/AcrR family transcriptional regulator [Tsukamurella paurometabola]VDR36915.1 HTH-type transcriptional repressor KstR2 [Tsukamurella paurometabola]